MTRPLVFVLAVLGGCSSGGYSGPRYQSANDGISFAQLDGWVVSRERATLLLRRAGRTATIAIRAVPRDGWSEPRTRENVFPAVASALRALPGAHVSGPTDLDTADYPAVAFDVEFAPPGGRRYQRRHVSLIAEDHVIHVFLVAPAGQLGASRRAFDAIVASVREEG